MPQVTKDQIQNAKSIDLLSYLTMYETGNLVHVNRDTYSTKEHDSLKISNGIWRWFSRDISGTTALKYLMEVKSMEFVDAVILLCGKPIAKRELKSKVLKKFALPELNENNDRVIEYLTRRGISKNIIDHCIENNLIYESKKYSNAVFVGYEKGTPRYAALRGTSRSGRQFKGEIAGSDKSYSFCLNPIVKSDNVVVTESAIDALSVATLDNSLDRYYLSLAGVYVPKKENTIAKLPKALLTFLDNHPEDTHVTLCLDNDETGRAAAKFIGRRLSDMGYYVVDRPPRVGKDWNDCVR